MKQEITAVVRGVYLADDPESLISSPRQKVDLSLEGLIEDKHYGAAMASNSRTPHYPRGTTIRNYRQLSIVAVEEMEEVARRMGIPSVRPEWLGANLLVEGLPNLTFLPPSTRLYFPEGATLVIDGENFPCGGPAKVIQDKFPEIPGLFEAFRKIALHLRGLVAWVERAGSIHLGDPFQARIPERRIYSLL